MPLPAKLIFAYLIVCEKVLIEQDSVPSVIRIADAFHFQRDPNLPEQIPTVAISIYFCCRFELDAKLEHTAELRLIRPNGEIKSLGPPVKATMQLRIPDAPPGFNVGGAFSLQATHTGIHYLTAI